MTHAIQHQYDEILQAALPGLEIHVVYNCESEIVFDEDGREESNRLLQIDATVNGVPAELPMVLPQTGSRQEREFLARLRESARNTFYRQQLAADATKAAREREENPKQYRRTMAEMFPPFRPITPGNDERFYG